MNRGTLKLFRLNPVILMKNLLPVTPFALALLLTCGHWAFAGPNDYTLPETEERSAVQAIIDQFDAVEKVERHPDKSLKSISLRGRGSKEKASLRLVFDPQTHRVTEVRGNAVGVKNDEFTIFAPLKELRVVSLHHAFCDCDKSLYPKICDGSGIVHLQGNAKLEEVALPGGPFNNDALAAVAQLPQLKRLGIWHVAVDDSGFAHLRNHPGLESVRVAPTWSPKITDKTIEHLSYCPNLKEISLNEGYVTWENGLRHLTKLKGTFQALRLENSVVAPEDLERFRREMPEVKVTHAGLAHVGGMIAENFKGAARQLPKWVPQELIDRYLAAAQEAK